MTIALPAGVSNSIAGACAAALGILLSAACHQVMEYSDSGTAGIQIVDTADFTVEGVIGGFEGARSMLYVAGELLVAANTGMVFWVDPDIMTVEQAKVVGQPFSSGYFTMSESREGTIYLIGGFNSITEFSPGSGIVLDEFSAGPQPSAFAIQPQDSFLYVFDGTDLKLREVLTVTNGIVREKQGLLTVGSMVPFDPRNEIMPYRASFVAAAANTGRTCVIMVSDITIIFEQDDGFGAGPLADIAALEDTAVYLAVQSGLYDGQSGATLVFYAPPPVGPWHLFVELDGNPLRACRAGGMFFVTSWLGQGWTRLTAIDGLTGSVVGSVDLPGYPWDVEAIGEDRVAVLTTD